jgi:hypothetical protein
MRQQTLVVVQSRRHSSCFAFRAERVVALGRPIDRLSIAGLISGSSVTILVSAKVDVCQFGFVGPQQTGCRKAGDPAGLMRS